MLTRFLRNRSSPGGRLPEPEAVAAEPWRGSTPPDRILAIRLQALGDTVLTLPYLNALRRLLPHATIDFLTRREVSDIPRNVVLFDRVFEIGGARDPRRQQLSALALLPRLWLRNYDVVIDLQRNRISRGLRRLLHPRAWSEFDRFSPRLAGERTRATIEAIGLGPLHVYPDLALRHETLAASALRAAGWDGAGDLVVLNPAGAFPGRSWPLESYVRFAALWLERESAETRFAMLGLPALAPGADYLSRQLGDRMLNLVGRTTAAEAFAIVKQAALVLSEDSGLMHMAWAAGTPTLGLFAASRAAWSRPHGNYSECLLACRRADGDCIDGTCLDAPPQCLERLSPEYVMERARELVHSAADEPKVIALHGRAYAATKEI